MQALNGALYWKVDTFLYGVVADLALSLAGLFILIRYQFFAIQPVASTGIVYTVQPLWGILVDSLALRSAYI